MRYRVYSEPGRGTTVKVYLPAIWEDPCPAEAASRAGLPRGAETLLLVEDDAGIRALLNRHLTSSGIGSWPCPTREALSEVQKVSEPIHLLITDVVMPLMAGRNWPSV